MEPHWAQCASRDALQKNLNAMAAAMGDEAFTLEGILYDLWPAFDMDAAFTQHLTALMTREIPKRFANLLLPMADRAENYSSLISNFQLHSLIY